MNSNGTGLRQLTTGAGSNAAWSPDGTKLVFAGNGTGLYVINVDGTNLTQFTTADDWQPAWSPDGTTIVYSRFDIPTGTWTLWTMDSNGGNETQLATVSGDGLASWSPDGTKIAFQSVVGGGLSQIYTMNADGSGVQPLTDSGGNFSPKWSPDGTKIGFTSTRGAGLWTMNPDGTDQVRVTTTREFRQFDWQPLRVTLRSSKATVLYPAAVTLTAHLVAHPATSNTEVSIYRIPYGGSETLVASGTVNASGDFSVTTNVAKKTSFVARWAGDAEHPAGGESAWVPVAVRSAVTGHLSRFYGRSGRYHLYHYTSNCTRFGRGCPTYTGTVRPNHAGQRIFFALQLYLSGAWRTVLSFRDPIGSNGSTTERLVYGGPDVKGIRSRIRSRFKGDADHLGDVSPWSYFRVTS